MKILFLSFYFRPDLSAGSYRSSALVRELLEQLPKGSQIEVFTTMPNRYNNYSTEALEVEVHPRLIVHRFTLPGHNSGMGDQAKAFLYFAKNVLTAIKGRNYDLIFATSSRLMTAVLAAFVSKKMNKPLYLDMRDIFVDTITNVLANKFSWLAKFVFSKLEKWTIKSAVKVNLVSEGFLPYFRSRYPSLSLVIFTNGIDEEFINIQSPEVFSLQKKVLNVVYAGNFGEGQGLHNIIPNLATRLSGRVRFKLIGAGGRRQELISRVEVAGCNNVEILPPIKREELLNIYQEADILFLHLNEYEAFKKVLPSKLFEYAALGKPIWAGVSGYPADFMRDNISNAAVFSPCDVAEATKAFETLELVTQPRKDFVEKFSRTKIMKSMAADIISVAKEKW